tara:strand:- start:558 stop:749 length:192 start_codon:yes stop_codon:yes gene_type:complete
MSVALVVLNVWHPGQVLVEKESEFLSRKERKRKERKRKERRERWRRRQEMGLWLLMEGGVRSR